MVASQYLNAGTMPAYTSLHAKGSTHLSPARQPTRRPCRLCWLGDAVLQLTTSELIYEARPRAPAQVHTVPHRRACPTAAPGQALSSFLSS